MTGGIMMGWLKRLLEFPGNTNQRPKWCRELNQCCKRHKTKVPECRHRWNQCWRRHDYKVPECRRGWKQSWRRHDKTVPECPWYGGGDNCSPRNMIWCTECIVKLSSYLTRQWGWASLQGNLSSRNVILWFEGRLQFPGTLTRQSEDVARDWTGIGGDNYSSSNKQLRSELERRIGNWCWNCDKTRQLQ